MTSSGRCGRWSGHAGLKDAIIADECPYDVEASTGQCQHGLLVSLALAPLAFVEGFRLRAAGDGDLRGQVERAQQATVVAAWAPQVAEDLRPEQRADTGHAQDRGGVAVPAKPALDQGVEGGEVLQDLGAQPVDRPRAVGGQVVTAGGEAAQVDGDLIPVVIECRSRGMRAWSAMMNASLASLLPDPR